MTGRFGNNYPAEHLSPCRGANFWVDGIHVQARLEDDAQCLLVIIGATPEGKKELVGLTDGVRERARSWNELLPRGEHQKPDARSVFCSTKALTAAARAPASRTRGSARRR